MEFRIIVGALFFSSMLVSGYHRRRADRHRGKVSLKKEGAVMVAVLRGSGLVFVGMILMFIFAPEYTAWATFPVPDEVRWFASVLGALTVPALWWMFTALGDNISPTVGTHDEHHLVTSGPYKYIQHPLYTFGMTLFACVIVIAQNWVMAGLAAAAGVALMVRLPAEEAELRRRFGARHRDWSARTGRLLPKLSSLLVHP